MENKISSRQFMIIVLLFTVGDSILYSPSWLAGDAKQDAWIGSLMGIVEAVLLAWLFTSVGKRFPTSSVDQICEIVFGKWIGKAIALLFLLFCFVDGALMQMEVGDFMTTQIMSETPIQFILITFGTVSLLGSRYGVETFARLSEFIFPWFLILFVVLIAFTLPQLHFEELQPVLARGFKPVLSGNLKMLGNLGETVILLMLFPSVKRTAGAAKAYFIGIGFGALSMTLITVSSILAIGVEVMLLQQYPSYVLAQKINIGRFFERFEAIIAVIWFITMYLKITVCFYAASVGLSRVLRLKDYRPVTVPIGMIAVITGLAMVPNRAYFDKFAMDIWMPYTSIFFFWMPLMLLTVAAIRKKRGAKPQTSG